MSHYAWELSTFTIIGTPKALCCFDLFVYIIYFFLQALMWITAVAILKSYILTKAYALTCPNVNVTAGTYV